MILTNCRVIPELCEGFEEEMVDIRVAGDSIAEILPAGGNYVGEEIVDCTGKTVLPGLFDLHVHLWNNFALSPSDESEGNAFMTAVRFSNALLAYGYTSVRDAGSPYRSAIKLRNAINRGLMVGPDIKACGTALTPHIIDHPGPTGNMFFSANLGHPVDGPIAARAETRRTLSEGADYIKIYGSYYLDDPRGDFTQFMMDEMEEIQRVATRVNSYMAVHSTSPSSNQDCIELGVHSIEHAFYFNRDNIDLLMAKGNKTALVPTLQCLPNAELTERYCGDLRLAHEAGALIGWGTDFFEDWFLNTPAKEFLMRKQIFGLSNVEILKQATINSAKINRTADLRGSIKVGKRADFAIVDGKPDEDFAVLSKPCACVIKDGEVVARHGMVKCVGVQAKKSGASLLDQIVESR